MTLSLKVITPEGIIGVADRAYDLLNKIYDYYGDCDVIVYDRDDLFGANVDEDKVEAYEITTISKLEW